MQKLMLSLILALTIPFFSPYPDAIPWENNLDYLQAKSIVNLRYLNNYDIDRNGCVFVRGSHFRTKQGRINFFGTNLTFDACFPNKDLAEKLAAQLVGLGIKNLLIDLNRNDNTMIYGIEIED